MTAVSRNAIFVSSLASFERIARSKENFNFKLDENHFNKLSTANEGNFYWTNFENNKTVFSLVFMCVGLCIRSFLNI